MSSANAPSSASEESDAQLIERSKRGDNEAFGDLYERYLTSIYRYVYFRVGNREEAEDLTEGVFLKAWKAIDNYQERGLPFQAWLYRIARNQIIDFRRRQKAQFVDIETQYDLPDESVNLEQQVAVGAQFAEVLAAIQELEPMQQEVLTLRFLSGLSHQETAAILEKKVGAVRVMQHRAMRALKQRLT